MSEYAGFEPDPDEELYEDLMEDGLGASPWGIEEGSENVEPGLMRDSELELAELGGPAAELSTGLILTWRGQLVFGLESKAIPLGAPGRDDVVAFVGIGGHLDPGESWSQAASREASEEAHCTISLGDSPITYLCRQDQPPRPIAYRWRERHRPLLVWVAEFSRVSGPVTLVNVVFRAAALGAPSPGAEVDALLLLDQDALLRAYRVPIQLAELQARGAEVIGGDLPPDVVVAVGGSAYYYAQWLAWQA